MKTRFAMIALYAVAIGATPDTARYTFCPHTGHYYKAVHVPEGISWSQAKAQAEQAGGYLATITSREENIFVFKLINNEKYWSHIGTYDNFGPWIGGYQKRGAREPDHGWCWVSGEEFFYTNWAPLEPSGRWKGKNENRLQLYSKEHRPGGKWNDALDVPQENPIRGYIIEKGDIITAPRKKVITEPRQELHIFTAANGKTCEGRVIAYHPNNDTVTIEKKNKKTCKVNLSDLSATDRTYIREWHLIREFCNEDNIRISAKQKQFGDERELQIHNNQGHEIGLKIMEDIGYDITLENRIAADLPNVTMDYSIYYEQDHWGGRNQITKDRGVKCGTINIGSPVSKATIQVETEPVVIFKRERYEYPEGDNTPKGEIQGIWIRVYLPLSDGSRAMKEMSFPNDIMKNRTWADSSMPAGMNRR